MACHKMLFGYSGLGYFKGKLYVATNIGLAEIENGEVRRLFRFQKGTRSCPGLGSTASIRFSGFWTTRHSSYSVLTATNGNDFLCRLRKMDTTHAAMC